MGSPPWRERRVGAREAERERYEEARYEARRCPECGKERRPPRMDACPVCDPGVPYSEGEDGEVVRDDR